MPTDRHRGSTAMSGQIKNLVKKITPRFLLDFYHYVWALASAVVFGFPSSKLTVIGVTGTSGKSTTVDFIIRILEEAGNKVVSNSSIRFKVGQKEWVNELKMGMPGRFFMQKLLRQGVNAGCNYAVLEVTSEGIKQSRHKFIHFDTAVFTNLSKEHIESHGGFENYRSEKLKLFKAAKNTHIINADDENAKYFLEIPAKKIITFGLEKGDVNKKNSPFHLNILGNFNVYNALAAISVAKNYGISLEICQKALEKVQDIAGRMEIVAKDPFEVIVDYAHTPEQLKNVYETISNFKKVHGEAYHNLDGRQSYGMSGSKNAKLICVLGSCGGGRDKWKRPVLGKIAGQYCKEIIITNEDPYDEDPNQILSEIKSGIIKSQFLISNFYEILDRKEAIKKALELAKPGDAVIITGKGSESLMCLENGKKIPWDDRQIVREELKIR